MELAITSFKIQPKKKENYWTEIFFENGFFVILAIKKEKAEIYGKKILDVLLFETTRYQKRDSKTLYQLLKAIKDDVFISFALLGFFFKDELYLGSVKEGVAFLGREKRLGKILSPSAQVKGKVKPGDILCFSSQKEFHSQKAIGDILKGEISKDTLENFFSKIKEKEEILDPILFLFLEKKVQKKDFLKLDAKKYLNFFPNISFLRLNFRSKLSEFSLFLKKKLKSKEAVWEDENTKRQKKLLLSIACLLSFLLLSSVFWNVNYNRDKERQRLLTSVFDLVNHQYEEAQSLLELNPSRARDLLQDAKISLLPLFSKFPKNSSEAKKINQWLEKIAEAEVSAYKIFKLTAVPLFFDLNLLKSGGEGEKIVGYKENKAILDTKNKVVYFLSTATKKGEIIAGNKEVKESTVIGLHGKNIYLLNEQGIVVINPEMRSSSLVVKFDEQWGKIVSLASYGGNLYLLDQTKNTIWKYIATDFGFSARTSYLNPDTKRDFSLAFKLVIDGSVWVVTHHNIFKFSKGLPENFIFKGFSETLENISSFSTDESTSYLYVLDKNLSRIVVFEKDGNYYAQYQWEELKDASDILVSGEEKKIFVLRGSKLYAIDIR